MATKGNLYDKTEIEKMMAGKSMDVQQEYMNQYTSGTNSIFGSLSEENEDQFKEWK